MLESLQPSRLDRFLRVFADVRAGEGVTALLLSLNVFVLLTCYSVLKPVREALILGEGSAEIKSYTAAAQVLVLALIVPLYGRLADRVPRRRLINIVTAIFAACLVGFYGLSQIGVPLGIIFYVWLGIFSVMLVAQFWAFANDIYSRDEGQRLFPVVAFGASLGAVLGAGIASLFIVRIGVYELMLVGAVFLVAQVQVTNYVDRREVRARESHLPTEERSEVLTATGSLDVSDVQKMLAERDARDADQPAETSPERTDPDKADDEGAVDCDRQGVVCEHSGAPALDQLEAEGEGHGHHPGEWRVERDEDRDDREQRGVARRGDAPGKRERDERRGDWLHGQQHPAGPAG